MKLTQGADRDFKKAVAIRGSLIASAIVLCVALLGKWAVGRYEVSLDAVRLAAGLVLLISALRVIFQNAEPARPESRKPAAIELAISPVAMPIIVPPAGIAAEPAGRPMKLKVLSYAMIGAFVSVRSA